MYKRWSESEIKILKENYNNIDLEELQRILNRDKNSIESKAKRLKVTNKKAENWTKTEIDFLINNYAKEKNKLLMKKLNKSYNSIVLKANRLNLHKELRDNDNMGVTDVNKDYFKNIDTPNKAYYLGWAITDGNVLLRNTTNQYRIRLNSVDLDILNKMKIDMMSTANIYQRGNYSELNICDREFVRHLINLGFSNNKTYTIDVPKIDDEFMWDFIKGVFDGDGCYVCTEKTKRIQLVSASEKFIKNISLFLINNNIINCISQKDNCFTIQINRKNQLKFS